MANNNMVVALAHIKEVFDNADYRSQYYTSQSMSQFSNEQDGMLIRFFGPSFSELMGDLMNALRVTETDEWETVMTGWEEWLRGSQYSQFADGFEIRNNRVKMYEVEEYLSEKQS